MSYRSTEEKRRPQPITFPLPPPPRPPPVTDQQRQQDSRNASDSTQRGQRSANATPMISPVESRPPVSGSGRSRTAMATFTNLIDQARVSSPRKSEHGSWTGSNVGSTARSRQSGRSQNDAATAQAQLEALDEETARGKMESRAEKNLFKMTGQIPPTPTTDSANEDEVYIRTEDLRPQCRVAGGEQQPEREQPPKSPKKKLFQNLRNTFSKSSSATVPPAMPNKAAQIFGTATRQARIIPVRPIKPARSIDSTPTRTSRSDTVKSLPAKIVNPDSYAHRHHSGSSRRDRTSGRGSPGRGSPEKQSFDRENTTPLSDVNASFDSVNPPPPPAKDTPPPGQRPASPLRRAAAARNDLREKYSDLKGTVGDVRFSGFDLSPLPSSDVVPGHGEASPIKFRPYTAEDYTKLIEGEPMRWPHPSRADSPSKADGKYPAPLAGANLGPLQLPRPDRKRERPNPTLETNAYPYSPLQPRFYSPTHLAARGFAEGETPSKNSDTARLLYSIPARSLSLLHLREESNDGSIKMIFQGDRQDIDPDSPTARELNENEQINKTGDRGSDVGITTRVMQELRIGEQNETPPQKNGNPGQFHPGQSSSRLTDMLNAVSPGRSESRSEFQPYCPSAVPSPLHKVTGPHFAARSIAPSSGSYGGLPQLLPPKTIDDHFFMTNEHLDVVGKTTWDRLDAFSKEQKSTSEAKHEQMLALIDKRFKQLSSGVDTVKETTSRVEECLNRVDGVTDNQRDMYATLTTVKDSIKETIPDALEEHDKKMTRMEAEMKEMKQMIQALQKSLEQKATEAKSVRQITPGGQSNTPNTAQPPFPSYDQRSQHPLPGFYGSTPEVVREAPSVMQHGMSSPPDGHNDPRLGYQNGNQWPARPGYPGRNGKEERPPYPASPYLYNGGGQYGNGYGGSGYPSYDYSGSPPDARFAFNNQGQAK